MAECPFEPDALPFCVNSGVVLEIRYSNICKSEENNRRLMLYLINKLHISFL